MEKLSAYNEVAIERKVPFLWNDEMGTVDIAFYSLNTSGHRGIVIRVDNITERIRIEEMMIQSEKMLSVGGLAAGMAHEINNPLGGITQSMQVIRNRLKPDNPANVKEAVDLGVSMVDIHRYLEKRSINKLFDSIQDAGQRAATIVRNMLSFVRKSDSSFQFIDINELLEKTVALAAHDFDLTKQYDFRKIEYLRQYDPALPLIPCQESEIQQVLLNILKNGAEAMAMTDAPPDIPRFILRTTSDRQHVHIDIEDNGAGMNEAISARIFEPFFTTKPPGSGTGLGLSVSYFIVTENHNGQMSVNSAVGKGTGFRISLPLSSTA
jgi:signal transduction histidine kinase